MSFSHKKIIRLSFIVLTVALATTSTFGTPLTFGPTTPGLLNIGDFSVFLNSSNCVNFYSGGSPNSPCTSSSFASTLSVSETDTTLFGPLGTTVTLFDLPAGATSVGTVIATDSFGAGSTFLFEADVTPATPVCQDINSAAPGYVGTPTTPVTTPISCVVTGSPFVFNQNNHSTGVQLTENLCAVTGVSPASSSGLPGGCTTGTPYQLTITSQFNFDIVDLLAQSQTVGGVQGSSTSGTFNPQASGTVPEPFSFILFGSGLVGVALYGRRHIRRS